MKKFFKILGILLCIIFAVLYICFLFVLPNKIDITQYKEEIQKIVKEQTNLDLNYTNERFITTPLLEVGFVADDIKVTMPDKSQVVAADKIKGLVSLPHALLLTVRVSKVDIENPVVNAEILKNGEDYKIVKHFEDFLNTKKESTFGEKPVTESKETEEGFHFNPEWIKIVIPNICLNNYKVLVTDLGTGHYLDLHGEKLIFGYFNKKSIRVRTNAELFSDKNKNISANIDIDTFLPPPSEKLDEEDDPAEKVDFDFINPVKTYQNYDLKADINSRIKIRRDNEGHFNSRGYFNAENLTLRLSKIQLPESYFKIKTYGKSAFIDSNIYATKDEKLSLLGKINFSERPSLDMNIKTSEIKFQSLLNLAEAYLESVQVKNELNQFKASGSILADCKIKTNFRKLKSNGFIKVQNGALKVRNLGEVLSKANINILLDDNILNIVDSKLFVENSEVKINGKIDETSYTDVNITTDDIPLSKLFNAFAPKDLRTSFNLKSGTLSSYFNIQGKMKEAVAKAGLKLNNFEFGDRANNFNIKNNEFTSEFNFEALTQDLSGIINNQDFKFIIPKTNSKISVPKINIFIFDKNIEIAPDVMYFNDNSKIGYAGKITNYENLDNIDFKVQGKLTSEDLIKLIGQELKPYIHYNGTIPVELSLTGDNYKKTLYLKAIGDKKNYITPIDFQELQNQTTVLQATIDLKPNRTKIKHTGLYKGTTTKNEEGQDTISLDKIIEIDGTLANNRINLMRLEIPENLNGKIYLFPRSIFTLEKTKFFTFGALSEPVIRGGLNINEILIPELHSAIKNINIKINGRDLDYAVKNLMLKNSDINLQGKYSLAPAKNIILPDLRITSNSINLDDVTAVTEAANKALPQQSNNGKSSGSTDIPVVIPNGSINMKKIKTGNIELTNITSQLLLRRNILYLRNLAANIFRGNVNGNIDVDIAKMIVKTDLSGKNIDIAKALLDSSGMKDALSGTTDFTAKLDIDISKTTPEEQIKGIEGEITFNAKDGQFGPFGKLENMILAENIRESQFFQTALGGVINKLSTIDTTHYTELEGKVLLKEGICDIEHITSRGNVMNLHILGKFDILKNYTDMKVRVKITSIISNLLGPINAINPVNLMNSAASMNVVTAKAFSIFCETVPEEEFKVLPEFSNAYVDKSATKFQLGVRGDVAKPLTLIKSFKWLASKAQVEKAEEYVNSLPEPIEGSTAETIEEVLEEEKTLEAARQAEIEAEKKTLKYKLKHLFKREKVEDTEKSETTQKPKNNETEENN